MNASSKYGQVTRFHDVFVISNDIFVVISHLQRKSPYNNQPNCWLSHVDK